MSGKATEPHPGPAVRDQRVSLGIRQEELAFRAGVAMKTVERFERGDSWPHRSTLAAIRAVLKAAEKRTVGSI